MFQDRRQHQRLTPNTPQLVLLDESKYSLLFDVCEGGLAIEGFAAQKPLDEFSLEFDLPEGSGCIQAKAEVVWTSESGYRTGFRFVDLADSQRQQLRTWIAAAASSGPTLVEDHLPKPAPEMETHPTSVVETAPAKELEQFHGGPTLFSTAQPSKVAASDVELNLSDKSRSSGYWVGIILAMVMSCIAFLTGYFWRSTHSRARPPQAAAPPVQTLVPSSPAPPSPKPLLPATASIGEPGFVLQVAAMQNETNADGLSASLNKQNFSAFVFKRNTDRLYRVVVGPFPKQELAQQKQRELEAHGFKPLLKRWSPE
jgi:septal ring-binding cell division protein DamX